MRFATRIPARLMRGCGDDGWGGQRPPGRLGTVEGLAEPSERGRGLFSWLRLKGLRGEWVSIGNKVARAVGSIAGRSDAWPPSHSYRSRLAF